EINFGTFSASIKNFELDHPQNFEVAKIAAAHSAKDLSTYIKDYALTQSEKYEVAKISASKNGGDILRRTENFELSEEQKFELAKISAVNDPEGTMAARNHFQFSVERAREIFLLCLSFDPRRSADRFAFEEPHQDIDIMPWRAFDSEKMDLHRIFEKLVTDHPELLSKSDLDLIDRTSPREAISHYLLASIFYSKSLGIKSSFQNLEDLLSLPFGVPVPKLKPTKKVSQDRLNDIVDLALEIWNRTKIPVFYNSTIDWNSESYIIGLSETLPLLRDLLFLRGGTSEAWKEIEKNFEVHRAFSSETGLSELRTKVHDATIGQLRILFSDSSLSLTYEDFKSLSKSWGSLEPFYSLIAKFRNDPLLLKSISRIFQAELDGTFKAKKFYGDPADENDIATAAKQRAGMSKEETEAWATPQQIVSLFIPNGHAEPDQKVGNQRLAEQHLRTNLLPHLRSRATAELKAEQIGDVIHSEKDPKRAFQMLKAKWSNISVSSLILPLAEKLSLLDSQASLKEVQKFTIWVKESDEPNTEEVMRDLQTLASYLKTDAKEKAQTSILVTTTVTDAKSLLRVGELVSGVHSCQSFKCGSQVQTLPGYVWDAHVIGALSFAIDVSHFKFKEDFYALVSAFYSKTPVEAKYDPYAEVIHFTLSENRFISTLKLSSAQKRNILKLGTIHPSKRSILVERSYAQTHPAQTAMENDLKKLVEIVEKKIGGFPKTGALTIVGSRGPHGHYSDAAGGAQKLDYVVP
ncbi:MAG: hypothetical protein JWQ35_169, partial [Bacteriovoracaceae bacterium]|nr:hypothetical protein [Bacteriovoracaceae bacterium]